MLPSAPFPSCELSASTLLFSLEPHCSLCSSSVDSARHQKCPVNSATCLDQVSAAVMPAEMFLMCLLQPPRVSGFGAQQPECACALRSHLRGCSWVFGECWLCPSSTAAKEGLIMQRACLLPLAVCSFASAGGEELCKEPFPGDGGRISAPCTN